MQREPLISSATIGAVVGVVLTMLVELGVPITSNLAESILQLVTLLAPVALSVIYARSKVSPVVDSANQRGPGERES